MIRQKTAYEQKCEKMHSRVIANTAARLRMESLNGHSVTNQPKQIETVKIEVNRG